MAPIDNGEEKIERVTSEIARSGGQAVVRVTMRLAGEASKAVVGQTLRAGEESVRRMANWASAAFTKPGGKVSMKELSELPSRAGREVVSLDDKDVMQALEKNLKGRGVHYAIEREKIDGKVQHILHVRGDDAQVVADSLERAAEAVDAKRERKQERDRSVDRKEPQQERSDKPGTSERQESTPQQKKPITPAQDAPKKQTEKTDRQAPEKKPAEKRSGSSDAQKPKEVRQREIREKVKARADKIKAEAPKPAPKLDVPSPGLKR